MEGLSILKQVLIKSVQKHGNQPLTVQHLINLINYSEKVKDASDSEFQKILEEAANECLNPNA